MLFFFCHPFMLRSWVSNPAIQHENAARLVSLAHLLLRRRRHPSADLRRCLAKQPNPINATTPHCTSNIWTTVSKKVTISVSYLIRSTLARVSSVRSTRMPSLMTTTTTTNSVGATSSIRAPTPANKDANRTTSRYLNNSETIYPISVSTTDPEQQKVDVLKVASALCPWLRRTSSSSGTCKVDDSGASVDQSGLAVRPLLGGLSNELFIVQNTVDQENKAVLVRIHPDTSDGTTDIVDRDVENRLVAWLSQQRLAPAFYGRFTNGRVEEFYPNVAPLSISEMPTFAHIIGQRLAQLHQLTVPDCIFPQQQQQSSKLPGSIWKRGDDWYAWAQHKVSSGSSNKKDEATSILQDWHTAWQWTQKAFQQHYNRNTTGARQFSKELVLAHMDCQSLNLLKNLDNGNDLRLIDFEYAGLNPRAADIANTFCEFCNMNEIKAEWSREYPTVEVQDRFLRAYLLELGRPEPSVAFLSDFRQEMGRHTLLSHLMWTVWALILSANSSNEPAAATGHFDHVSYARQRMDGYRFFRERFWDVEREDKP